MTNENNSSCQLTCWIVAAMVSVAIFAMLMLIGDWSFIQAVFAAGLALVVLGFLLSKFICTQSTAKADLEAVQRGEKGLGAGVTPAAAASAAAATGVAASAPSAGSAQSGGASSDAGRASTSDDAGSADAAGSSVAASNTTAAAFAVQPSAKLAGQDDLSARKGSWKYEGEAKEAPAAKKPAAQESAAQTAAPQKAAPKKAAPKKAAAAAAPAVADTPAAAESKPETLSAARGGQADDLKLIGGVGPKLEGTLNELGFYHFDQVAAWGPGEVSWVDSRLKFKGRITRDNWIDQAKILASGGETEFSKKKKK